jgi:tetratricopeptide (TPR) repeat protein
MNRRKFRVFGALIAVTFLGFASPTVKAAMEDPINDGKQGDDKGGQQGQKSKKEKKSEQEFRDRYLHARSLIIEKKYQEGISALHKIGRDDLPDIANYIGYSYRMLGDYDDAKIWYEKALAADPNHIRTWQYYGMWQVERGNMLKAAEHLEKLRQLCGTDCKEYADLKSAMEGHVRY